MPQYIIAKLYIRNEIPNKLQHLNSKCLRYNKCGIKQALFTVEYVRMVIESK